MTGTTGRNQVIKSIAGGSSDNTHHNDDKNYHYTTFKQPKYK
jgi:hypothetical protein